MLGSLTGMTSILPSKSIFNIVGLAPGTSYGYESGNDSKFILANILVCNDTSLFSRAFNISLMSIKNLFNIILKHSGKAIESVVDMFAYTSLLIPVLNSVNYIIDKYDLTMDTLVYNLSGIAMGVLTLIVKHGVKYILKRLGIKNSDKEEIISDIEDNFDDIDNDPSIHNVNDNI